MFKIKKNNKQYLARGLVGYLSIDLEFAISSLSGVNGEFSRLVDDTTSGFKTWSIGFDLQWK